MKKEKINKSDPLDIMSEIINQDWIKKDHPDQFIDLESAIKRQRSIDRGFGIFFLLVFGALIVFMILFFSSNWESEKLNEQINIFQGESVYKDTTLMKMVGVEGFANRYALFPRRDSVLEIISYQNLSTMYDSVVGESNFKDKILKYYKIDYEHRHNATGSFHSWSSKYQDTLFVLYNIFGDDIYLKNGVWHTKPKEETIEIIANLIDTVNNHNDSISK